MVLGVGTAVPTTSAGTMGMLPGAGNRHENRYILLFQRRVIQKERAARSTSVTSQISLNRTSRRGVDSCSG